MRDISAPFDIYTSVTQPFNGDLGHMHNRKTYKQIKAIYQDAVSACCIVINIVCHVLFCNYSQYYKINKSILFNNLSSSPTNYFASYVEVPRRSNESGCAVRV